MILSVIWSENWTTSVSEYQFNKYGKDFEFYKEKIHFSDVSSQI